VLSSKAIAAGVPVYLAADGRVTDTAASNKAVGVALTAASGADKLLAVLLKPLGTLS
jgi:predicted RecA/RadA family phage recombinase